MCYWKLYRTWTYFSTGFYGYAEIYLLSDHDYTRRKYYAKNQKVKAGIKIFLAGTDEKTGIHMQLSTDTFRSFVRLWQDHCAIAFF